MIKLYLYLLDVDPPMLHRSVACFLLLVLAALLFNSSASSASAATPNLPLSRLSPEDEGLNAEIILSPGKRMAEARAFLVEANRMSRQRLLSKQERAALFAGMIARQQPRTEAIQPMGLFGNSFDGQGTAQGAILLGWSGANPTAWCSWLTISSYCHAGLFDRGLYYGHALWRAFTDTLGIDLDVDGGYLVFPGDIRWDIHTSTVRSWQ